MSGPAPLLTATDLGRRFAERWAVAGVNLRLTPGRSLLLAGHNGAGKTTLLRLLAGVLRPSHGAVARTGAAGFVGHRGGHYLDLSPRELLRFDARALGRTFDRTAADALLGRFGLDARGSHPVGEFSAGMKKRLSLARLVQQDPPLVLLDEPYGELDQDGAALVDEVVHELLARGRALVMSTHLFDRAAAMLHAGLVLDHGRMAWVGAAAEVPAALCRLEAA